MQTISLLWAWFSFISIVSNSQWWLFLRYLLNSTHLQRFIKNLSVSQETFQKNYSENYSFVFVSLTYAVHRNMFVFLCSREFCLVNSNICSFTQLLRVSQIILTEPFPTRGLLPNYFIAYKTTMPQEIRRTGCFRFFLKLQYFFSNHSINLNLESHTGCCQTFG